MRAATYVCVPCRKVAKSQGGTTCPTCRAAMSHTGTRWRPPLRTDDAAWRRIAKGEWLTERAPRRRGRPNVPYLFEGRPEYRPRTPTPKSLMVVAADILRTDPHGPAAVDLARHPHAAIRQLVAEHPTIHPASLLALLRDPDPDVQAAAVQHPTLPPDPRVRRPLLKASAPARATLATRPDLEPRLLRRLLRDPDPTVARAAAGHPTTPLTQLADLPLGWLPATRLGEVASGASLVLLRDLHTTSGQDLSLADGRALAATVLGPSG